MQKYHDQQSNRHRRTRKKKEPKVKKPIQPGFECHICGARRRTRLQLRSHIAAHKNDFVCMECEERFTRESELKFHVCSIGMFFNKQKD